ncbi:hypothetical protein [Virgibacillus phasianinus]|uniref:hypothetical protein n=1 Tax=Virgibacillus phasianinus TaxID=2017483 RepID=UPI001561450D|nr:hypothetical protein [Virgibacillus phasianinus]
MTAFEALNLIELFGLLQIVTIVVYLNIRKTCLIVKHYGESLSFTYTLILKTLYIKK